MITVKLFAMLRDRVGADILSVNSDVRTVGDLLTHLAREYPPLAELIAGGRVLVSVNEEFAAQGDRVNDGDEVALMPPFSGGS